MFHKKIINILVFILWMASPIWASPIIDGRFDPNEGYTHFSNVAPTEVDAKNPGDPAQLWLAQNKNTKNLSVLVMLPKTYVDNTYGNNSIGWKTNSIHTFKDLVKNDVAEFSFSLGNQTKLQVSFDYLRDIKEGKNTTNYTAGLGGDGMVKTGLKSNIVSVNTSLNYNINTLADGKNYLENSPATDDNYANNVTTPGWVFDVAYEFEISGDTFGNIDILGDSGFINDFNMKLVSLHASPSKGSNFSNITPPSPTPVPEPISVLILLVGLALMAKRKKRVRTL